MRFHGALHGMVLWLLHYQSPMSCLGEADSEVVTIVIISLNSAYRPGDLLDNYEWSIVSVPTMHGRPIPSPMFEYQT